MMKNVDCPKPIDAANESLFVTFNTFSDIREVLGHLLIRLLVSSGLRCRTNNTMHENIKSGPVGRCQEDVICVPFVPIWEWA
jgi:hypothetical protein